MVLALSHIDYEPLRHLWLSLNIGGAQAAAEKDRRVSHTRALACTRNALVWALSESSYVCQSLLGST